MKKRILALLICALLLAQFVACGNDDSKKNENTVGESGTQQEEGEILNRQDVKDNLPERDYDGADFVIAMDQGLQWAINVESTSVDKVDAAIYKRNQRIMDRFDIKFSLVGANYWETTQLVKDAFDTNLDTIDLVLSNYVHMSPLAVDGYALNWYEVPYVDFDKPWWVPATKTDLTYKGYCPMAVGDFVLGSIAECYGVFFNTRLASDVNISYDEVVASVDNMTWTIDKAGEYAKNGYVDLNKNQIVDEEDQFGYVTNCTGQIGTYLWALGSRIVNVNGEDFEVSFYNNHTQNILEKVCDFVYNTDGVGINKTGGGYRYDWSMLIFADQRAIFSNGTIDATRSYFRNMNDDYLVIPYPIYDETQTQYYTRTSGTDGALLVPSTVGDPERSGIITEALCAESYKYVVTEYFDDALKGKYSRDDNTERMLDLILASRCYDFGYVYGVSGVAEALQGLVQKNSRNLTQFWDANGESVNLAYNTIFESFIESSQK